METEQQVLRAEYLKAQAFSPINRIEILEEFKILTDSSNLSSVEKEMFKRVADEDINQIVECLQVENA